MHAGARALARGVEALDLGAAVEVRDDPAHRVVRRRRDRDRLGPRVVALVGEPLHQRREAPAVDRSQVEQGGAPRGDGPGDDVAGRELVGEAPAVVVEQDGALPAQRLGEQEPVRRQDGRVELHELEVRHRGPGFVGELDSGPDRAGRVGRALPERGVAAGGEQRGGSGNRAPVGVDADATVSARPQAAQLLSLAHLDARMREHALGEDAADPVPGGRAADVRDPPPRVAALQAELGVERDAQLREVLDARCGLRREGGDGARPAQAPSGVDRVVRVLLRGVVGCDRGGHAALGERARRPLPEQRPLREHQDVRFGGRAERSEQAGDASADDDDLPVATTSVRCAHAPPPASFRLSVDNLVMHPTRVSDPEAKTASATPTHVTLAVVFQVRAATLQVLLWERAREPLLGTWSLPGGYLEPGETLEDSIRRQLALKVDVRELSHLEQLETLSEPDRHPWEWQLATAYLGLVPLGVDPAVPPDTSWRPVDDLPRMAFDHGSIVLGGRERLRAKLSYTNVGFALAPEAFTLSELREVYVAALGHPVSTTNLKRVLLRRRLLEATGERRSPGPSGGRPAELFRFRSRRLEVTDPFAVLRPPRPQP